MKSLDYIKNQKVKNISKSEIINNMGNEIVTTQLKEVNLDPNSMYSKRWNEISTKSFPFRED